MNIKRFSMALLPLSAVLALVGIEHGRAQTPADADITKFEAAFSSALARNGVDELERFLSDDWKIISSDGDIIDKKRFLKVIASGDLTHTRMTSEIRSIRRYGSVALGTAHAQSAGSYKSTPFETDEIGTDVIANVHGQWVCVLTQLSKVAK